MQMENAINNRAVIITGPVGSGKSSTAKALAELLEHNNVSCALIDMDAIRWFHPTPEGDPFGTEVGFLHLRIMANTYRSLGIPLLILADVIETGDQGHRDAIPDYPVVTVRLDVAFNQLRDRLEAREVPSQVPWHLERAQELQHTMEQKGIGDHVLSVEDESVEEIAAKIAEILELL